MMSVQPLGLVPAGVVQNEKDPFAFSCEFFRCNVSRNAWKTSASQCGTMRLTSWPFEGLTAPMTVLRKCPSG